MKYSMLVKKPIGINQKPKFPFNITEDHPSSCWPKDWLSKDVPTSHIRMLAVDYESRVSEWQIRSMPRNIHSTINA